MSLSYLIGQSPLLGKVTPLIDGFTYFQDFFDNLETLQEGDKLYLLNWHINKLFFHKGFYTDQWYQKSKDDFLLTRLHDLVKKGVEVKILLWVNTNIFLPLYPIFEIEQHDLPEGTLKNLWKAGQQKAFGSVLRGNLTTAHVWRKYEFTEVVYEPGLALKDIITEENPALKDSIIINTLDALGGGIHAKFALFLHRKPSGDFEAQGYTGGIDLSPNRYAETEHAQQPGWVNYWHDVMVKLEGDINYSLFQFYQDLWNENINRKESYNPEIEITDAIVPFSVRCIPDGATPIEAVELLQSDNHDLHWIQSLRTIPDVYPLFGEPELSFAEEGVFEIRDSLQHAFEQASLYIYIEDQKMNSLELFGLLKDALHRNDELQIILLTKPDPADAPTVIDKVLLNYLYYSELDDSQRARLHFFEASYTIHSKLYLVDDAVAIVGSAGFMTRSMSQELEHSVAFTDKNGSESIKDLREKLWTEHTGIDIKNQYPAIAQALALWNGDLSAAGLKKIALEEYAFADISDFWEEIPWLLAKAALGSESLTTDEQTKLNTLSTYKSQLVSAAIHLITWELPFSALLNPSTSAPLMGIPFIDNKQVAVYEKARLELISSQVSVVEWTYTRMDGTAVSGQGDEFEIQFHNPGSKTVLAVQRFAQSNKTMKYPFTLSVLRNSGPDWYHDFPTSTAIEDLSEPFRTHIQEFIAAVEDNTGLTVQVLATLRPPERAYLMAYAYKIANGLHPEKVKERLENVNISWVHYDSNGNADLTASRQAAQAMVLQYDIGSSGAAFPSKHSEGTAIDMKIVLNGPVQIKNKEGDKVWISNQSQLKNLALTYNVRRYKLTNHWSLSGH